MVKDASIAIALNLMVNAKIYNLDTLKMLGDEPALVCPNHCSSYDGIITHAVCLKVAHTRTMVMAEAFEEHSSDSFKDVSVRCLFNYFDIKPLHRKKEERRELLKDLINCSNYLKEKKKQFLIIFPDGAHVDPKRIIEDDNYVNTIPKGAFTLAKKTNRKIIPVFLEPSYLFEDTIIIIGDPLYPSLYDSKEEMLKAWYNKQRELYQRAKLYKELDNQEFHSYKLSRKYHSIDGNIIDDPNRSFTLK